MLTVVTLFLLVSAHLTIGINHREPFHNSAGDMETDLEYSLSEEMDANDPICPPVSMCIPVPAALSQDCLMVCLEYLNESDDFDSFRSVSRLHADAFRAYLRFRFKSIEMLFNETWCQKRIQSWQDIENDIPIVPGLYLKELKGLNASTCTAYPTLSRFHQITKKSIIRGLSGDPQLPFLSFRLTTSSSIGDYYKAILVCIFEKGQIRRIMLFNKLEDSSSLICGPKLLDLLLNGQPIKYQGSRHTYWLQRSWTLVNDSAVECVVSPYPLIDTKRDDGRCLIGHALLCVAVFVIVFILMMVTLLNTMS